jgi:hypothetical protein
MWLRYSRLWTQYAQEWFLHEECDFHTQCDFNTHKCDYDTHDCDFNTYKPYKSDLYTQSVILTRIVILYAQKMWLRHASECDFDTY